MTNIYVIAFHCLYVIVLSHPYLQERALAQQVVVRLLTCVLVPPLALVTVVTWEHVK